MNRPDFDALVATEVANSILSAKQVATYFDRRIEELDVVQKAIDTLDYLTIQGISHRWAGSGETYGFTFLTSIGFEIEHEAKKESGMEEIKKGFAMVREYLDLKRARVKFG